MAKSDLAELLNRIDNAAVTSHVNPDGDAIGSVLAMTALLRGMGKQATPVLQDGVPDRFRFLTGSDEILSMDEAKKRGGFESMVLLDAGELSRCGEVATLLTNGMPLAVVDHHVKRGEIGDASLIETSAAATCELLVELYGEMKQPISEGAANAMYVGIMTDTGRFRFSNTSSGALTAAATLVDAGASPEFCAREIYFRESPETTIALGKFLSRLTFHEGGKLAVSYIPLEERYTDTEGFIDHLTAVDGVEIAALLRPLSDGSFKVSFRSTGKANVEVVARSFGGGGHEKAAGGTVDGTVEEAISKVLGECKKHLPE